METLIEFLATTGCVEDNNEEKKITLMEFLFGTEERKLENPVIEINAKGISLSESNVNVKNLTFIDETPDDEGSETLVEILLKYMEDYGGKEKETPKSLSVTPSLSEKSKSDMTISKFETISDISKTKSDSTLTQTQETVIDRNENSERRISETVIDLSNIKSDLESIFEEAILRVYELNMMFEDTMSEQEDIENFNAYTKPPQLLQYSVELSDILEEDDPEASFIGADNMSQIKLCAEELMQYIENKIQDYAFNDTNKNGEDIRSDSSGPSTEEFSREFDLSPSLKSVSLVDLRNIPDLPQSTMVKPKVLRVDKSTSTTEISESISEVCRRIDSGCMTDDTVLTSSSERNERALDKLESLHRFFSRSRLEIIDESLEENGEKVKSPKEKNSKVDVFKSKISMADYKIGQASLDDVEDILEDNDRTDRESDKTGDVNDFVE